MAEDVIVLKQVGKGITAAKGFRAAGLHCGIKRTKKDLALVVSETPGSAAGVFTQNRVKAAPVIVCQERVKGGILQAILICSGNANACTGEQGLANAYALTRMVARQFGLSEQAVAATCTGVIGVQLPMDVIEAGIQQIAEVVSEDGFADAAEAIMTTDTAVKQIAYEVEIGGLTVRVGGMAKGSGMIHPNMATMLAFITTDAVISPQVLQTALSASVNKSFNMITVDGDTSTNDSVLVIANGMSGCPEIKPGTPEFAAFSAALDAVCIELAKMIVSDGEGASKLIEINVCGARSDAEACLAAKAIARSNLVKTAIFGEDANWGRIVCAAGYSGAEIDSGRIDVKIGSIQMCEQGEGLAFDEELAKEILREREVVIQVGLNLGTGKARVWTCDLTYDYVKINASYRS
ncbi:MAG: bifunctional glutamate N-acetyltransferase/amino-acid acetyltransferase ArgJ [Firmicutes bacterium]|jgi:glutamate N-acetyltransferase/amino-acid N-acetyltransferase|nr:bifunctional glutamate N-acetyltransferase/amino-acid acetyltransferase ArgJ [Bacillota bacterium]NLL89286.1 bifunctional glutamate N-acetyltransferase/amino-acid acetyltransferase ArgJ [Bacillota bacterium]